MAILGVAQAYEAIYTDDGKVTWAFNLSSNGQQQNGFSFKADIGANYNSVQSDCVAAIKTYMESIFSITFGQNDTIELYMPDRYVQ